MEKIRTNHIKVHFLWDEFLEDFDLYKIEYSNAYDFGNNLGIYCKLEGLCPNSAVCAFNKMVKEGNADAPTKHRIFLFASAKKESITTAMLQERLEKGNVKIKQISYNPDYREGIYPHNMLNLMLSMMPNRDKTLSYAHGKLICGTCSSLYNKGKKQGEELGLQLEFAYGGLLEAHTSTFAEADKVENSKKKDSLVYHLEFGDERIYFSSQKKKGTKEYYNHPSIFRKNNKNRIPFLDFSDIDHLEESQAYIISSVLNDFLTTYSKYILVYPVVYNDPQLLQSQEAEFKNEDELVRNMLSSSWINISCHTKEEGVEERRALIEDKSKVYINKLFKTGFEGTFVKTKGKNRICIRIVGDKDQEAELSTAKRRSKDRHRLQEKLDLMEKLIPVQDSMIGSEINDATIKNIFRQILIKKSCLQSTLPQAMIERFKGCVITYAESKVKSKDYYFVQMTIDNDGQLSYRDIEKKIPQDGVISVLDANFEMREYQIPDFKKGYNKDIIYCIEKDGVKYNIYDTEEYIFPELDEMTRALKELKDTIVPAEAYQLLMDNVQSVDAKTFCQQRMRENKDGVLHNQFYKDIKIIGKEDGVTRDLMRLITKEYHIKQGQDFRTASRREETLGACVNVHYWKYSPNTWMYCAGPNPSGNFSSIDNKVHVRELVCDKTPDEAFVNELICSLGDGWNKINEFSVHPSIFKFLKERLEMYKVKEQLDEISSKD